jgi:hypothetical protein
MRSVSPRELKIGSWKFKLPASRVARLGIAIFLIVAGFLGFLPILGFWMIPLGLLIISYDIAVARRARRKLTVWWGRTNGAPSAKERNEKTRGGKDGAEAETKGSSASIDA